MNGKAQRVELAARTARQPSFRAGANGSAREVAPARMRSRSGAGVTRAAAVDLRFAAVLDLVKAARGLAFPGLADAADAVRRPLASAPIGARLTGVDPAVDPRLAAISHPIRAARESAGPAFATHADAVGPAAARRSGPARGTYTPTSAVVAQRE